MGAVEDGGGVEGPEGGRQHTQGFALFAADQIKQARRQHIEQDGKHLHRQHVEHPVVRDGQILVELADDIQAVEVQRGIIQGVTAGIQPGVGIEKAVLKAECPGAVPGDVEII